MSSNKRQITAIPTVYKRQKFRSRLEARWAVFFDELSVDWEYEKEGFDLGSDLGLYLPDFWLPCFELWVEIKPTNPTETEFKKIEALSGLPNSSSIIFWGSPGQDRDGSRLFCADITDSSGGDSEWQTIFAICYNKCILLPFDDSWHPANHSGGRTFHHRDNLKIIPGVPSWGEYQNSPEGRTPYDPFAVNPINIATEKAVTYQFHSK